MRAAPSPAQPVTVDVALEVRQPTGETRLFPIVEGRIAQKAMEDRAGDYVLSVQVADVARPASPWDWFACAGQTARVQWRLSTAQDTWEIWSNIFLLETWEEETPGVLDITGHGVAAKLWTHEDARARQWLHALARDVLASLLAVDGVPVRTDPAMPKDELPARWVQGTDRWQAVLDLLESVSGLLREDPYGVVLKPQYSQIATAPDLILTDGDGGTVVHVPTGFDRRDRPNHVVVRGRNSLTDKDFVTEAVETTGPYRPALYGWVTHVVDGDTVSHFAQAQLVATNTLVLKRHYRQVLRVECATDWRLELDDPVEVRTEGNSWWGRVLAIEMPLSGLGTMIVEVGTE